MTTDIARMCPWCDYDKHESCAECKKHDRLFLEEIDARRAEDDGRIGYLVPDGTGFKTLCNECHAGSTLYAHLVTPVYEVNLGRYQQHCMRCGKNMNPHAVATWPELFDGKR